MITLDIRDGQTDEEWEAGREAREKRFEQYRKDHIEDDRKHKKKEAEDRKVYELRRYGHRFVDYQEYLKSSKWQVLRQMVFDRCGGICEACKANAMTATHHITYRNLGDEKPWQLLGVCELCHDTIHGIGRSADDSARKS